MVIFFNFLHYIQDCLRKEGVGDGLPFILPNPKWVFSMQIYLLNYLCYTYTEKQIEVLQSTHIYVLCI